MKKTTLLATAVIGLIAFAAFATGLITIVTQTQQDVYYSDTPLCVQQGACASSSATTGISSNNFPVAYNAKAPVVLLGNSTAGTNLFATITSITKSNFVFFVSSSNSNLIGGVTFNYIAVGAP